MKTVCDENMCAGCMACTNICKKNAITIVDNYKAYNAKIDESKCVRCGLCEKVCPNVTLVDKLEPIFCKEGWALMNNLGPMSLRSGYRKPQIRF